MEYENTEAIDIEGAIYIYIYDGSFLTPDIALRSYCERCHVWLHEIVFDVMSDVKKFAQSPVGNNFPSG